MNDTVPRIIEFDIRGQICPSTLLIALREMNRQRVELKRGGVTLSFLTNNRDCLVTIPDAARNMGYSAQVSKRDDYYVIAIEGVPLHRT